MPWITYVCIILCFVNFLRELSLRNNEGWNGALIECGAMYPLFVSQSHQYWRLVTAGFVHFSWWHLLMNMYVLWQLGAMLEGYLGHLAFAVLLFAGIVVGNLFACYMGDNDNTVSGGMSTGLYALMCFEIVLIAGIQGWSAVLMNRSVLYTLIVNMLMNFLPGVSWKGHLGGACTGIVFAVIMLRIF